MCQFNFLVIKREYNSDGFKEIASEYGLNFNEKKLNIINADNLRTFITTKGECDCGSVLGINNSSDNSKPDLGKFQKKLERKRFSRNRINLLLEQKRKEYIVQKEDDTKKEFDEANKWINYLSDNRIKLKQDQIGILYHQFSGDIETDTINIKKESINPLSRLDIDFIKDIKENELSWIKI